MAKTLIIAEKPSVATDLQRALAKVPGTSKFTKEKDWFENDDYVVSSAVGHLLELAMPNTPDGRKPGWKIDNLPIIPEEFPLEPIEKTKSRLKVLERLMKRKDVDRIINACDAGREGELIFRYLVQAAGVRKPIQRLWMQSMTQQAILDAFAHLRSDEEMRPLADAAMCRSESDWLVGINGTRALTAFSSRHGGFVKTPVGRVQTPTLTILVEREKEIQSFEPRTYWEVHAEFAVEAGSYQGRWFDEAFRKDESDAHRRAERLWERSLAEAIRERCEGRPGVIEEKRKPQKQGAPLLYDLTSLQREANGRFGFSARRTLQLAQALYEQYKVLTYPRTDSRYLPEDYIDNVRSALRTFGGLRPGATQAFPEELVRFAHEAVTTHGVVPNRRIFNNSKVSDHFAIIPTGQIPKTLDDAAAKIYRMVVQRFIAVFFPAAEFEITTRITRIDKDAFRSDGRVMIEAGWQAVYGRGGEASDSGGKGVNRLLVAVRPGEPAATTGIEIREEETKPPPHFNEATLLSTMEGAGKLVDDEELAEAMSERGLGTPATRASIIEGLIREKYVLRDGKDLVASPKGIALIDQVRTIGVDLLTSPELTGKWEYKLKQMEHGQLRRAEFMGEIQQTTGDIVTKVRNAMEHLERAVFEELDVACPECGSRPLRQTDAHFDCTNPECKFRLYKTISGRNLTLEEARTLIEKRFLGPLTGFRSRFGTEFEAALELKRDKGRLKPVFVFEGDEEETEAIRRLTDDDVLCTFEDGRIYETDNAWVLLRKGSDSFDKKVRLPKTLCQREIPREQALRFFRDGATEVIENFISKKGRPFSASLVFQPEGRRTIQWRFPPRPAAKKKEAKKKQTNGSGDDGKDQKSA